MRSTSLAQVCYALKQQFIQKPLRSSPLSFDRSELVCRRWVGKRIWLGRIRKRASPAENKKKKLRNSIACENSISRALGPCTLHKKHTQNAKINLSPSKGDRYTSPRTLHQRRLELWVGGRAECESRATPLSTRSISAEFRSSDR